MTTPLRITTRNSTFQQLASLRTNRQKRSSTRTFLLEGVQPLNLALSHGWHVEALIHAAGKRLSDWATDILASHSSATRYVDVAAASCRVEQQRRAIGADRRCRCA